MQGKEQEVINAVGGTGVRGLVDDELPTRMPASRKKTDRVYRPWIDKARQKKR